MWWIIMMWCFWYLCNCGELLWLRQVLFAILSILFMSMLRSAFGLHTLENCTVVLMTAMMDDMFVITTRDSDYHKLNRYKCTILDESSQSSSGTLPTLTLLNLATNFALSSATKINQQKIFKDEDKMKAVNQVVQAWNYSRHFSFLRPPFNRTQVHDTTTCTVWNWSCYSSQINFLWNES